jgi:MoxR-like ATPase
VGRTTIAGVGVLLAEPGPDVTAIGTRLRDQVEAVVAGQRDTVEIAVATLLSGGHLLVEDIPGVGKTLLAQTLARAVGGTFHRIQGTSDLLPGDITGTMLPSAHLDLDGMTFRPGPVFANVVVFDELNRATPRTQSALLELAEEATVTVDGVTHPLPDPFMIVATQNPLDAAGTYGLGDGALDRFRAVVSPGRAPAADELEVIVGRRGRVRLDEVRPVVTLDDVRRARAAVGEVAVANAIGEYVVRILQATRQHPDVRVGASTRGGVALVALARALAALRGRKFVVTDDVVSASVPVLSHRLAGATMTLDRAREIVRACLAGVTPPTV